MKKISLKDLKEGQKILVHPSDNRPDGGVSDARHPYHAVITRKEINWTTGPKKEWCISVDNGTGAVINDYLLSRIEIIG